MSFMPKVSVLIPTYNRASLLVDAIESVLAQTYTNTETIVIDDGSTDNTAEVVRRYELQYPERVRYIWQKNQGASMARNNAVGLAKGEYIAFLDSDDRWLPEKLEWQLRALQKFDSRYPCFSDAKYTNNPHLTTAFALTEGRYREELGVVTDPTTLFFGGVRSGLYVQTFLVHRDLARRVGDFDPKLRCAYDTDYLFRLALMTPFCYVNKPLVEIDRTVNRELGLIDEMGRDELFRLQEHEHLYPKLLALIGDRNGSLRSRLLECVAETHNDRANWHLYRREWGPARKEVLNSVTARFTPKAAVKLALTIFAPAVARREYIRREAERAKNRVPA